jgi:hypothetical protein
VIETTVSELATELRRAGVPRRLARRFEHEARDHLLSAAEARGTRQRSLRSASPVCLRGGSPSRLRRGVRGGRPSSRSSPSPAPLPPTWAPARSPLRPATRTSPRARRRGWACSPFSLSRSFRRLPWPAVCSSCSRSLFAAGPPSCPMRSSRSSGVARLSPWPPGPAQWSPGPSGYWSSGRRSPRPRRGRYRCSSRSCSCRFSHCRSHPSRSSVRLARQRGRDPAPRPRSRTPSRWAPLSSRPPGASSRSPRGVSPPRSQA